MSSYDIEQILNTGKIKSVETFLPTLPPEFRKEFSLKIADESSQFASLELPRLLFFGDPLLVMAVSGAQNKRGSKTVEIKEFNEVTRSFDFIEIEFGLKDVPFTMTRNPAKCVKCHAGEMKPEMKSYSTEKMRPNWSSYPFWEKTLGSHHRGPGDAQTDNFEPIEEKALANWLKLAADHPRYRHIVGLEEVNLHRLTEMNGVLTDRLIRNNAKKIASEIVNLIKTKEQYIAALYVAFTEPNLGNPLDVAFLSSLLPKPYSSQLSDQARKLWEREKQLLNNDRARAITEHAKSLGVEPSPVTSPLHIYRNLDLGRVLNLFRIRFLFEQVLGHAISHWSMRFRGEGLQVQGAKINLVEEIYNELINLGLFRELQLRLNKTNSVKEQTLVLQRYFLEKQNE